MTLARRFAALVLIVVSLLVPGGSGSAWAMSAGTLADHAGQADCPHAAMLLPSGDASHASATAHVMPVVSGAAHPRPAAAPTLPSCCIAMTTAAPALESAPARASGETGGRLRPLSDAMPAQRSIGPDLPPPRA